MTIIFEYALQIMFLKIFPIVNLQLNKTFLRISTSIMQNDHKQKTLNNRTDIVPRVPPVVVELPVGEVQDLTHRVEEGMEYQVEHRQPDQMIRNLGEGKRKLN